MDVGWDRHGVAQLANNRESKRQTMLTNVLHNRRTSIRTYGWNVNSARKVHMWRAEELKSRPEENMLFWDGAQGCYLNWKWVIWLEFHDHSNQFEVIVDVITIRAFFVFLCTCSWWSINGGSPISARKNLRYLIFMAFKEEKIASTSACRANITWNCFPFTSICNYFKINH